MGLVDVDWYRRELVRVCDLWDGGLDGRAGMGAFIPHFDGYFHVELDREWRPLPFPDGGSTTVAQCRAVYLNAEAHRALGRPSRSRFLDAVVAGVECLLSLFLDPTHGGFHWRVARDGRVLDDHKHGYGNVHALFALSHAHEVTGSPRFRELALQLLTTLERNFLDPRFPGAFHPGLTRDFSRRVGVNNVDVFTHYFEALLALHDIVSGKERDDVAYRIREAGSFLVNHLYCEEAGHSDRGYVAYNYDDMWRPSQLPYTRATQWSGARHATTGHNVELAFLLSRAVERGFDPAWLTVGRHLMRFACAHAIHPVHGGMIHEITDYDGQPLAGNPDNPLFLWWAQAETARAFFHFSTLRHEPHEDDFRRVASLFHGPLTDAVYGGLFDAADVTNGLDPVGINKGNVWKVNYHYTMFFAEVLRLG